MTRPPPESLPAPVESLRAAFAERGLPLPPLPQPLAATLSEVAPLWWCSEPDVFPERPLLVTTDTFARDEPVLGAGFSLRGAASNAVAWLLVDPPLHVALQLSWANYGSERDQDIAHVRERFGALERLLAAAEGAAAVLGQGEQLVVVEADLDGSTWGIFPKGSSREELMLASWRETTDALGDARDALLSRSR